MPKSVRDSNLRIPIRNETRDALRDLAYGFNRSTYDDVIAVLVAAYLKEGETPLDAGRRLAAEHAARQPARPGD
jgi:hypothetical protein